MTQTKDRAWIRQVLERHERPLVQYAARLLRDVERARDVVQETFLRLCKQERADVDGHVEVWLFTVCRNLCNDSRRKESRMTELDDERVEGAVGTFSGPAEVAAQKDSHAQLLDMIASLPDKQQEVLRLKFQHGLSYKEISRVTQDSLGNVGWLLHTGLKSLRERMGTGEARGAQA
ncbi:MAG: RNA polymerase sigma factor (sigma-70 family) [Candidatus Paceibacteria bacterium]|jgi:RNA polymerase sigma factor (sigma-70 family)